MGIVSGVDIIFHASQLSSLPFAKLHIGSFPAIWEAPQTDGETVLSFFSSRKMSFLVCAALSFTAKKYHVMPKNWSVKRKHILGGKRTPLMISAIWYNSLSIAVLQIDLKLWCDWELFKLLTYQIAIVGELCNFAILQSSLLPKSLLTNNLNWFWYKQLEAIIGQECDTPANYWPCNWWSLG